MDAYLLRTKYSKECTIGYLYIDGFKFATLEPPWLDNEKNKSCIPAGYSYSQFINRSASGKYKNVYHLVDVKAPRSGILIHNGNTPDHTKGCILIGLKHGKLAGKQAVLSSRIALRKLNNITNKSGFKLWIY